MPNRLTALCLIVLIMSGCGFALRSDVHLADNLGETALTVVDEFSPFARQLRRSLERSGVVLVDSPTATTTRLDVSVNEVTREILTIGDTARVREYRIRHLVQFQVTGADGQQLLALQTLEQSRDLSFDEGEVLAATREEEFIREELSRNMVRQVMRQLSLVGSR